MFPLEEDTEDTVERFAQKSSGFHKNNLCISKDN